MSAEQRTNATDSTSSGGISKADYEMLAAFRHALRMFFAFSEEQARSVGITTRQYQALLAIKGFPGRDRVTITELAENLHLKHNTTVELVDRLEDQELAQRFRDSSNRKLAWVRVTDRGEQLLRDLAAVHREQIRRLSPQIRSSLEQLAEM